MNTCKWIPLTALFAVTAWAQPTPAAHWEGTIHMPDQAVRFSVDLARQSSGEWVGSVSIPDGGAIDAPLSGISVQDGVVRFRITGMPDDPSFVGKFSEDGGGVAGTATSDKGSAAFELKRSGEANVKLPPPSTQLSKEFEGSWEGTIEVPGGGQLRAVLKLARASDGTATGKLISVDEGVKEYSLTTITQRDKQLQFEIRVRGSKYTGLLSDNGDEIAGEYSRPGIQLPLVFKRSADEAKKP